MFSNHVTGLGVPVVALAITFGAVAVIGAQQSGGQLQGGGQDDNSNMLTFSRDQAIIPAYQGWHPNPDGTIDLWFGYLNKNWREEPDVPVGPNNSVNAPYGPDAGQPTHFLPRNNRFIFAVRVSKDYLKDKNSPEVVWTITVHGKTYKAYATLHPAYIKDDSGMQREFFGTPPPTGNKAPEMRVEGQPRNLKVGELSTLTVIATDDGIPGAGFGAGAGGDAAGGAAAGGRARVSICGDKRQQFFCGDPNETAGSLFSVKGLRMACFLYRGPEGASVRGDLGHADSVVFDPPQAKVWEDNRGGSPWASGYRLPPIPEDNIWNIKTSFKEPGIYVVRCQAHDGLLITNKDITFTVTR